MAIVIYFSKEVSLAWIGIFFKKKKTMKNTVFSLQSLFQRDLFTNGTIFSYIPKQHGITPKGPDCLPESKAIRGWMSEQHAESLEKFFSSVIKSAGF